MNPLHLSKNPCYGTPWAVATAALCTMGEITLDPASSPEANRVIGAREIFTKADNGLSRSWHGSVLLNPPGGVWRGDNKRPDGWADLTAAEQVAWTAYAKEQKELQREQWLQAKEAPWWKGTQSIAITWIDKLLYEYAIGNVYQAIFVAFNRDVIAQRSELLDYPICLTTGDAIDDCVNKMGRMAFLDDAGQPATAPTHSNAVVFLPPRCGISKTAVDTVAVRSFMAQFDKFGRVGMMLNPLEPLTQTADGRLYINDRLSRKPDEVAA